MRKRLKKKLSDPTTINEAFDHLVSLISDQYGGVPLCMFFEVNKYVPNNKGTFQLRSIVSDPSVHSLVVAQSSEVLPRMHSDVFYESYKEVHK